MNIIPIKIPPLRERKEDIVDLFFYFMKKYSEIFNYKIKRLNDDALELLLSYDWPGNVRQLENLVQYICCTNENDIINREILMKRIPDMGIYKVDPTEREKSIIKPIHELEYEEINKALDYYGHDTKGKMKAAEALGIGKSTLYNKINEYNKETKD